MSVRTDTVIRVSLAVTLVASAAGCSKKSSSSNGTSCAALTGTPWVPNVAGVSTSNHDSTIYNNATGLMKTVYTANGYVSGVDQGYGSNVLTVNIDMSVDLGTGGSLSLVATPININPALDPTAVYPVLVSLSDGTNELVNTSGCSTNSFYNCTSSSCTANYNCNVHYPSAYFGTDASNSTADVDARRDEWEQHNPILTGTNVSVTTFPTCGWSGSGSTACAWTSNFFNSGKLRTGTYVAKYVLVGGYLSLPASTYSGGVQVTAIRKKDATPTGGAIDLNVIIVGSQNVQDSRTAKGQQNLDLLFTHVYDHYYTENASTTNIKLGKITAYEWGCAQGGDAYANNDSTAVHQTFRDGSKLVDPASETQAINIFLVSTVPAPGLSGTILGISGGITGSMINGTMASGAAFSTFNDLATYNPSCTPGSPCPTSSQEEFFVDMGATIAHEMGHYLGLYHPSERSGTVHDPIPDTPTCTTTDSSTGDITISSCQSSTEASCYASCSAAIYAATPYCPSVSACQFNHTMWWSNKHYNDPSFGIGGDGNIFSTDSAQIINYNPYVQ